MGPNYYEQTDPDSQHNHSTHISYSLGLDVTKSADDIRQKNIMRRAESINRARAFQQATASMRKHTHSHNPHYATDSTCVRPEHSYTTPVDELPVYSKQSSHSTMMMTSPLSGDFATNAPVHPRIIQLGTKSVAPHIFDATKRELAETHANHGPRPIDRHKHTSQKQQLQKHTGLLAHNEDIQLDEEMTNSDNTIQAKLSRLEARSQEFVNHYRPHDYTMEGLALQSKNTKTYLTEAFVPDEDDDLLSHNSGFGFGHTPHSMHASHGGEHHGVPLIRRSNSNDPDNNYSSRNCDPGDNNSAAGSHFSFPTNKTNPFSDDDHSSLSSDVYRVSNVDQAIAEMAEIHGITAQELHEHSLRAKREQVEQANEAFINDARMEKHRSHYRHRHQATSAGGNDATLAPTADGANTQDDKQETTMYINDRSARDFVSYTMTYRSRVSSKQRTYRGRPNTTINTRVPPLTDNIRPQLTQYFAEHHIYAPKKPANTKYLKEHALAPPVVVNGLLLPDKDNTYSKHQIEDMIEDLSIPNSYFALPMDALGGPQDTEDAKPADKPSTPASASKDKSNKDKKSSPQKSSKNNTGNKDKDNGLDAETVAHHERLYRVATSHPDHTVPSFIAAQKKIFRRCEPRILTTQRIVVKSSSTPTFDTINELSPVKPRSRMSYDDYAARKSRKKGVLASTVVDVSSAESAEDAMGIVVDAANSVVENNFVDISEDEIADTGAHDTSNAAEAGAAVDNSGPTRSEEIVHEDRNLVAVVDVAPPKNGENDADINNSDDARSAS
jgi:hypothetical protein